VPASSDPGRQQSVARRSISNIGVVRALPIGNRRYGRLEGRATRTRASFRPHSELRPQKADAKKSHGQKCDDLPTSFNYPNEFLWQTSPDAVSSHKLEKAQPALQR
jgi:hypothetical protein